MSERTSQTRRILHIVDAHVTGPDPVCSAVRAAGGVVERCSDVYEGLSRLERGGSASAAYDAVVLCLDYLAVDEYEFITLAKRSVSGLPVLVRGGVGSTGDVGLAMALGAERWVDGSAEALRGALVAVAGGATSEGEPGDSVVSDDDTSSRAERSSVRVPWSRGSDVPVRRPPGANGVNDSIAHRSAGSLGGSEDVIGDRGAWSETGVEPLLSAGELAALTGVNGDGEGNIDTDGGAS